MNPIFEKGGKLYWLHSTVDAFESFLHVPGTVTRSGSHVRDAVDLKRIMIVALLAAVPAALFGIWNVGYQHALATGAAPSFWPDFWFGFLKVLPLFVVSYVVGLAIEFGWAQARGEEVNEGYLVTGFFIPLIVPVDVPLWMLGIAVAFSVIFVKEVFGGTGMNIWNPALMARAFLFFSYPSKMTGPDAWIALRQGESLVDAASGATPLSFIGGGLESLRGASVQYGTGFWDLFLGTVPGSVGETSVAAILIGAFILLWTGIASWKVMLSCVAGALLAGGLAGAAGLTDLPAWYHLVMGGFAFGTVFMATDPVTCAQTETGKWIYGLLIGVLCVLIRLFNPGYPEGMMLAILLGNTFAPLIDYVVTERHISRKLKRAGR